MLRGYVHDCIPRGCERLLPGDALITQESIQYLFFLQTKTRIKGFNDFLRKINEYKIKKEFAEVRTLLYHHNLILNHVTHASPIHTCQKLKIIFSSSHSLQQLIHCFFRIHISKINT